MCKYCFSTLQFSLAFWIPRPEGRPSVPTAEVKLICDVSHCVRNATPSRGAYKSGPNFHGVIRTYGRKLSYKISPIGQEIKKLLLVKLEAFPAL